MRKRPGQVLIIVWLVVGLWFPGVAPAESLDGRLLTEVLEALRSDGLPLIYSNDLVKPWMRVREEPPSDDPERLLEFVLAPYALSIRREGDLLVVVKGGPVTPVIPATPAVVPTPIAPHKPTPLAEVVVSASRYQLQAQANPSTTTLSAGDLNLAPNVGGDPLRVVARLPGVAAGDLTARPNIRGGEYNETLIRFDDLRLIDPFHLRDFQAVFSAINPALVDSIDIYTGAFPVAYGNRMSSVIDVSTQSVAAVPRRELSVSFFNASLLLSGATDTGTTEWVASLRRGNLDLVLEVVDPARGNPRYVDGFARIRHHFTDSFSLSASVLVSDDRIQISDNDAEEQARADARDLYFWLRADWQPSDQLRGHLLLSQSNLDSLRLGIADQPGIAAGSLRDERDIRVSSLLTEWEWQPAEQILLQLGGELRQERASFDYQDEAEFDLVFIAPGSSTQTQRFTDARAQPRGTLFALFGNLRFDITEWLTAEFGLRWDRSTLTPESEDLFSPRINLLYRARPGTRLRIGWGQFYQSQGIHELQVNDGILDYLPAQSARHLVAGLEQELGRDITISAEVYDKTYDRLRPRYENFLDTFRLLPEIKPDRIRNAPLQANARGIEISLVKRGAKPLSWWASYAYARAEDEFAAGVRARDWDQRHTVNAGIVWATPEWEFGAAWKWHSGWPTTRTTLVALEPTPVVLAPFLNGERLDEYSSLDLRVARNWLDENGKGLSLFLDIRNLLNRKNPCCVEYEVTDENGPLDLLTETVGYPGLIPSIGFTWSF